MSLLRLFDIIQVYEQALEQIATGHAKGGSTLDNWVISKSIAEKALTEVKGERPDTESSPDQYVIKHATNGYLKRRGHSDEPSLDFTDDINEAKHYSYEGALRLADIENTRGNSHRWSVRKAPKA